MTDVDKHFLILAIFARQQLGADKTNELFHLNICFYDRYSLTDNLFSEICCKLFVKCNTMGARDEAGFAQGITI